MKQTFIIEGNRLEIEVKHLRESVDSLDVTPVGSKWRESQVSGTRRLELHGKMPDGREIRGLFQIVDQLEDGTVILEPWSQTPVVGEEE